MGEIKCEKCSKSISVEIVNSMTAKASSSTDLESSTRIQDRHFCAECIQSVSHGDGIQGSNANQTVQTIEKINERIEKNDEIESDKEDSDEGDSTDVENDSKTNQTTDSKIIVKPAKREILIDFQQQRKQLKKKYLIIGISLSIIGLLVGIALLVLLIVNSQPLYALAWVCGVPVFCILISVFIFFMCIPSTNQISNSLDKWEKSRKIIPSFRLVQFFPKLNSEFAIQDKPKMERIKIVDQSGDRNWNIKVLYPLRSQD